MQQRTIVMVGTTYLTPDGYFLQDGIRLNAMAFRGVKGFVDNSTYP